MENRQRAQSSQSLNRAGPADIHKANLRQPAASPHPVRKERINQTRQQRSRPADGAKLPAVGPAAERDLRRQADAQHLQPHRQRGRRAVKLQAAQEQRFGGDPVPGLSGQVQNMPRTSDKTLPGESAHQVHQCRDGDYTQRSQHGMSRAAGTAARRFTQAYDGCDTIHLAIASGTLTR